LIVLFLLIFRRCHDDFHACFSCCDRFSSNDPTLGRDSCLRDGRVSRGYDGNADRYNADRYNADDGDRSRAVE
jgi:hypothetical protein